MTRDEKIAEARRMRADGSTLREIGERFGVSASTVMRWTDDEHNARQLAASRANKLRYRGECVDCGSPTVGDAPGNAPARCVKCNGAHTREMSRRWILESFAEWHALFGSPPSAQDWNQGLARAGGRLDLIERYEATGRPWPTVSLVQQNFGSWNAGVAAAGFAALAPGDRRGDPEQWRANLSAAMRESAGTEARRSLIAALYDEGLTAPEIAAEMGVTPGTVYDHLRKMRRDGWALPYRAPWLARAAA